MADYITDTGQAAVLRSGVDRAQDTPPCSLLGFRDKHPVCPPLPRLMSRFTQLQ